MLISSGLSSHPDVVRPSWWVRNRRMQTSPKIVVLLSALLLLAITGILAPTSSNRTLMSSTSYCDELPAAMDVSHAIMMAYASLIGLLAWSLRGLPYDSFALGPPPITLPPDNDDIREYDGGTDEFDGAPRADMIPLPVPCGDDNGLRAGIAADTSGGATVTATVPGIWS
jgi:hypothetical protein